MVGNKQTDRQTETGDPFCCFLEGMKRPENMKQVIRLKTLLSHFLSLRLGIYETLHLAVYLFITQHFLLFSHNILTLFCKQINSFLPLHFKELIILFFPFHFSFIQNFAIFNFWFLLIQGDSRYYCVILVANYVVKNK